ncbi:hypothetical protein GIB67_021049 [Kingdonia uniflora]|uniref:Starch synthase catalytic domain-containing protein n=1 Tax=Kingdonia uniflora TaxID=39325 RepID=A0A7J7N798_9MAGN|nr:hypothetical protein GIB67_021049 [Kingdonia uniflora]
MAANEHRVMTVCPRYNQYKDAWNTSVLVEIKVGDKIETVRFFHCYKRGVDRVFVDHPIFLEKAALEAPRVLSLNSNKYFSGPYGDDVVFIVNDWHMALFPCYIKSIYKSQGIYESAKVKIEVLKKSLPLNSTPPPLKDDMISQVLGHERRGQVSGLEFGVTLTKLGIILQTTGRVAELEEQLVAMMGKMEKMSNLVLKLICNQASLSCIYHNN